MFFAFIFFLGIGNHLKAQQTQTYEGPLKIGKYKGEAKYAYTVKENDTLLNGSFVVQRSNLQELIQQQDYSFLFKGSFEGGIPNGPWNFQFGNFNSKSKSEVVDYQYRVLVSGTQEAAKGTINMGKPNGDWSIIIEEIEDSEIANILFKSDFIFDNGIPQQNFSIKNKDYTLVGRFLRNGLAQDEWSLFPSNGIDQTESWNFTDGLLKTITVVNDGKTETISLFDNLNEETAIINLDERYLKTVGLQLPKEDIAIFLKKGLPSLLKENTEQYQKIDSILSELGPSDFLPEFKVKVPLYALDSVEIAIVDSIKSHYRKAQEISSSLLNNSQLNILKLSDRKTLFWYNTVAKIQSNFISPLQLLASYDSLGILGYASRTQLIDHLFPNGLPKTQITVDMDTPDATSSEVYTFPKPKATSLEVKKLSSIENMAQMVYEGLLEIETEVTKTLTVKNTQQELVALEEEIILQNDSLNMFLDSVTITVPPKYKTALVQVRAFADNTLNAYSNLKSSKNKIQAARDVGICLSRLKALAHTVVKMPSYWNTIQETYTDRIWNPFTATLMDEAIKKRITSSYINVLEPYFLGELQAANLSCKKINMLHSNITDSYTKIISLKEEDTDKLERRLRRENDPVTVLELLNVQTMPEQ